MIKSSLLFSALQYALPLHQFLREQRPRVSIQASGGCGLLPPLWHGPHPLFQGLFLTSRLSLRRPSRLDTPVLYQTWLHHLCNNDLKAFVFHFVTQKCYWITLVQR